MDEVSRLESAVRAPTLSLGSEAALAEAPALHVEVREESVGGRGADGTVELRGVVLVGSKVTQPTPVPPGVPIRIGKTVLELRR